MGPILLLLATAGAAEPPRPEASLHGDVKLFFLAGVPRPWFGLSDAAVEQLGAWGLSEADALEAYGLAADPFAQGVASARLKGAASFGPVRLDAHWAIRAQNSSTSTAVVGLSTGVGARAPELLPLTWSPDTGPAFALEHRIDRLAASVALPHVDLALGRQPLSFGVGRVFTPMDLVNPFHPATIDTEYKPGVDALRVDAYAGTATKITAAAAWAGDPVVGADADGAVGGEDVVVAATGQATVGVTDLLALVADVRGEPVAGLGAAGSIGVVGVHAEGTVTVPAGADPFVRAVAGGDWRPTGTTSLSSEVYVQTFGATDPSDYLAALQSERARRGEVWEAGQIYASVAVAQEVTPIVHLNLAVIGNLRDPSALAALGGVWSVSDESDVVFGSYVGLGRAPERIDLELAADGVTPVPPDADTLADSVRSEFGLYPTMGYVQLRSYF